MALTLPTVAIVILNYNGVGYLQKFLPSVLSSTYTNKEVIIADNASTDDSVNWLKENHSSVSLILLKENYGFAKGYNEALKQVKSDYYVLLNSDVEVTENWIEPVIALMETDKKIGACQPKILSYHDKSRFEYAGACGGWIDSLGYPFSRGRVFDDCEVDNGQYNSTEKIFWASGAAFFVRANVYKEMLGFDEYFFAHQEEIDLCWRMQLSGFDIMVCPQSVVYHVGGGTLPKGERKAFLNFRNNLIMVYKNWNPSERIWKVPVRMALDVVSIVKAAASGDRAFAKGVLKAQVAYIKWCWGTKNGNNFSPGKNKKLNGIYKGVLVVEYFLKKKKKFSEIVLERN